VVAAEAPAFQAAVELEAALRSIPFRARVAASNLSDAATLTGTDGARLVIVADEGTELAILEPDGSPTTIDLAAFAPGPGAEIDLEAVATQGDRVFVSGSASLKRRTPKGDETRLLSVVPASGEGDARSNDLFVFRHSLRDGRSVLALEARWDLRAVLVGIPALAPFAAIPSKDNGIDVEGLAVRGEDLYFGLRGPVLRGHAVVVRTDHRGGRPEVFFLHLDGLGIRGLRESGDALLVLAGPTMDLDAPYAIHRWDGRRSVLEPETPRRLATIPRPREGKAEGIFRWRDRRCVLFDGPAGGAPICATDLP
jgi:hypothetical protein